MADHDMTYEQRLDGICRMIAEEAYKLDPGDSLSSEVSSAELAQQIGWSWHVDPGDDYYAKALISPIEVEYSWHASVLWKYDGLVVLDFVYATPISGAPTSLTVLAAADPMGDFQVAETLGLLL